MKSLLHILVLSCKKASYLIDKGEEVPLSWLENLQLKWHKRMCDKCQAYERQSKLLNQALHNKFNSKRTLSYTLSKEARVRINSSLQNN